MRGLRGACVLIASVALVAAACTSDSGGDTTGGDGAQEEVTLEWWGHSEGGRSEFVETLIERFEAEYPNININVTAYPEGQYATKIETAVAVGRPPDLGSLYNFRWMREGLVLTLDDMVQEQGIDLSAYNPSIVGDTEHQNGEFGCAFEGKLYCLGSYVGAVGIFYNKDLFDAAGIEYPPAWPPMTINEFVDLSCRLTDEPNGVWGAAYGFPVELLPWEAQVSPDGRTSIVNSSTNVGAYEAAARGFQDGCAPSPSIMDPWEQGADYFADGQLAMVNTDLQSFKKIENAGINYGVTSPPTVEGVEPFVQTWTDGLGVFAGSEHPDEAKLFIAFLTTEGQTLRVEINGDMPLSQALAEETNWTDGIPGREDALEIVGHARPAVFIPNRWDTVGPLYDAFSEIVDGSKSAQAALDEAQPAIQQELDSAWEVWDKG